jgi:hypothetical protein
VVDRWVLVELVMVAVLQGIGGVVGRIAVTRQWRCGGRVVSVLVALLLVPAMVASCGGMKHPIAPPPPAPVDEVATFKPPLPERWSLPNGLQVFFVRDDELPWCEGGSLYGVGRCGGHKTASVLSGRWGT